MQASSWLPYISLPLGNRKPFHSHFHLLPRGNILQLGNSLGKHDAQRWRCTEVSHSRSLENQIFLNRTATRNVIPASTSCILTIGGMRRRDEQV